MAGIHRARDEWCASFSFYVCLFVGSAAKCIFSLCKCSLSLCAHTIDLFSHIGLRYGMQHTHTHATAYPWWRRNNLTEKIIYLFFFCAESTDCHTVRPFPSPSCFVRTQANLNINVCTSHSDCLRCSDFGKRNQKNSGTGNSVQCAWNNARFCVDYHSFTTIVFWLMEKIGAESICIYGSVLTRNIRQLPKALFRMTHPSIHLQSIFVFTIAGSQAAMHQRVIYSDWAVSIPLKLSEWIFN